MPLFCARLRLLVTVTHDIKRVVDPIARGDIDQDDQIQGVKLVNLLRGHASLIGTREGELTSIDL
jgi:hypothetical protein